MIYRSLGKTGIKVSQLAFGAMRLPMTGEGPEARVDREKSIPMIHAAFNAGVNYIDSAVFYCNEDSQRAVGDALKGFRDRIIVSTKNHYYDEDEKAWWSNLENSLERLGVSYLDVYHHHGVNWDCWVQKMEPRVSKWMRKAVDQKLVKHIACSFHDNNEALLKLIDTGYPEIITLQYNMLDRQLETGIAKAYEKGIGIVVMGPVGGGRLGVNSDVLAKLVPNVQRVPELALRFVLANPHVSTALSGMSTLPQVQENMVTAADPARLTATDLAQITEHLERLKRMADLYCTGCDYCKPCPQNVDISGVFNRYNTARVYGLWDVARENYAGMLKNNQAVDRCVNCGDCETKCPQHLAIRTQLADAHAALVK